MPNRKVGVSYADYGSPEEESNFMLASNTENGETKAEETGRMLKKAKKSEEKKNKKTPTPSHRPSKTPSMVFSVSQFYKSHY